ncbi:MAG: 3D domain-containing protein [Anaplasmataceae bacterium]|nr:3D domain-containing protein [Anaplasmataceae bacterium]
MGKRLLLLGLFLVGAHIPHYDSIAQAPQDKADLAVEEQSQEVEYTVLETHEVWATAYTSAPEETDDTPHITAMGTATREDVMATNFLPFGTKVRLPEIFPDRVFIVEDRMHPRMVGFIDIWMDSKEKAYSFGKRRVKIEIITDPEIENEG